MYTAMDIADHIVVRCANSGRPVANLQLQKILYYVQLNFLRTYDKCIFEDEQEIPAENLEEYINEWGFKRADLEYEAFLNA